MSKQRLRRILCAVATAGLVVALSSCRPYGLPAKPDDVGGPTPTGSIGYQPPFLPIVFSIGLDGGVAVEVESPQLVTPVGSFSVSAGSILSTNDQSPLPEKPADATQLIICPEGTGTACQAYVIGTGRKMRVQLDGQFLAEIERNKFTVRASRGSTVTILDNGPPPTTETRGPARLAIEEIDFTVQGTETEIDLERSRSGWRNDLVYDHLTGRLSSINGAQISHLESFPAVSFRSAANNLPSEYDCQKRTTWATELTAEQLDSTTVLACVKTAEADLGYLYIMPKHAENPIGYYVYSHIWVR